MAKVLTLEQAAKVFVWMVVASVLLFVGPRFADRMIFDPQASTTMRWMGVSIAVISVVPWLAYAGWGLTVADEYHRQMLLVGTALAFALALLFSIATQLMADAHLTNEVITLDLRFGFLIWLIGIGISALHQRLRSGR